MTAERLKSFIEDNGLEFSRDWNIATREDDIFIWVDYWLFDFFREMLPKTMLSDRSIHCVLKEATLVVYMRVILDYCDIAPVDVFGITYSAD